MSEFKVLFAEGSAVNRPPMFNGMNYAFWKIRMRIFMECIDALIWNIITSTLTMDEFFKISQCKSAKEMWEVLEVTHEGTEDVKRSRKHALIQEYEFFKMQPEESIANVQKRFTHIVNHLTGLGK